MNVRDFLDSELICETGSPRKAAVVPGVARPTLGNRIAHREDQIGVPLLDTDINAVARPGHPLCADPPATIAGLFKYLIALPITERHYLDAIERDHGIDIENLPGRILCSDASILAGTVQRTATTSIASRSSGTG